jgi:hypothetical protein
MIGRPERCSTSVRTTIDDCDGLKVDSVNAALTAAALPSRHDGHWANAAAVR